MWQGHNGCVTSVAVSPDNKRVVSGSSEDNGVRIWDMSTGALLHTLEVRVVGHAYVC